MKLARTQTLFWQAIRAQRAPRYASELFVSRGALDAAARIQIYRRAYWARHEKALRECFPVLLERVGPGTFRRLVAGYIERHPSRSAQIERTGEAFPAHVAASALLGERAAELGDLARLEWARVIALLGDDAPMRFRLRDLACEGVVERALRMLPSLSLAPARTAVWRGGRGTLERQLDDDEARALARALCAEPFGAICSELADAARAQEIIAAWIARGWITELI